MQPQYVHACDKEGRKNVDITSCFRGGRERLSMPLLPLATRLSAVRPLFLGGGQMLEVVIPTKYLRMTPPR